MSSEWTTVSQPTRRRRPQRARDRKRNHVHNVSANQNSKDASRFFEKAVAAQLQATVNLSDSVTQDEIEIVLKSCLRELETSKYWENIRSGLTSRVESLEHQLRSIVCYGIGNFGIKRPSGPMWQLALALLIHDYVRTETFTKTSDSEDDAISHQSKSVEIYYFEPLMTAEESKVLERRGVHVIDENERGRRTVDTHCSTLFFMPHCPMTLYSNLFHTNWDSLQQVIIFGNSLNNYVDGKNVRIANNPVTQQALTILEVLKPIWVTQSVAIPKTDILDMSANFEKAFNDSSFTSFPRTRSSSSETEEWPEQPKLDFPTEYDGEGEVL